MNATVPTVSAATMTMSNRRARTDMASLWSADPGGGSKSD